MTAETHTEPAGSGHKQRRRHPVLTMWGAAKLGWGREGVWSLPVLLVEPVRLEKDKELSRQMRVQDCFPAQLKHVYCVTAVKACWVLEALWAPRAVRCCLCVSQGTGGELGTHPWLRLGRELHLNKLCNSPGLETCVPFLQETGWDLKACRMKRLNSEFGVQMATA